MSNQSRRNARPIDVKFEQVAFELADLERKPSEAFTREAVCEYVEAMITELVVIAASAGEELLAHLLDRAMQEANVGRSRARSRGAARINSLAG